MKYGRKRNLFLLTACFTLLLFDPAYAYLDPGSGSLILQIVLAALLAAGFTAKLWLKKTIRFFRRLFTGMENQNSDERK